MQIMHYACKYPDRVSGLVLLATQATSSPADQTAVMARVMRRRDEPWFAKALEALQKGPPKTDEEMALQHQKLLPGYWADPSRIEKHQEHFAATSMSVDAQQGAVESRSDPFDLTEDLKKVTAPALIVAGDQDIICPASAARQIHLCLPNSKLLLIEDSGHFMWMEQAEEFESQVPLFLEALGVDKRQGQH